MLHYPCFKFYRVYKNDTAVTLVSTNNFRKVIPPKNINARPIVYSIPPDAEMYVGYTNLITALEKAKAGALAYILQLIMKGEAAEQELLQYRMDHYEDLNINLVESHIQETEIKINSDKDFYWKPYRIKINYDNKK